MSETIRIRKGRQLRKKHTRLANPMPSTFLALVQRDPHEDTSAKYSSFSEEDGGMVVGRARAERFIKYT